MAWLYNGMEYYHFDFGVLLVGTLIAIGAVITLAMLNFICATEFFLVRERSQFTKETIAYHNFGFNPWITPPQLAVTFRSVTPTDKDFKYIEEHPDKFVIKDS